MNRPVSFAWSPLDPDERIRWLKYSFGPGTANSLAVRVRDAGWIVISPPSGVPARLMERLAEDGDIKALVAPNAYHSLGQATWRERFPRAVSYAPDGAFERLSKKSPSVPYQSLRSLGGLLNTDDQVFLPDGMKSPDVLFQFSTSIGPIWWLGDLFSNTTVVDQVLPLRLLARVLGSGLGYRCNAKPELVYVRDRAVWLASMRTALLAAPPAIVVPAHGDPVTTDTAARTMKAMQAIDRG